MNSDKTQSKEPCFLFLDIDSEDTSWELNCCSEIMLTRKCISVPLLLTDPVHKMPPECWVSSPSSAPLTPSISITVISRIPSIIPSSSVHQPSCHRVNSVITNMVRKYNSLFHKASLFCWEVENSKLKKSKDKNEDTEHNEEGRAEIAMRSSSRGNREAKAEKKKNVMHHLEVQAYCQ